MGQDYTTMRVPTDAHEAAQEAKNDEKKETWGEYLRRCSDNPPEIQELVDADAVGGLSYDDVKAACAAALQEELPESLFRK